MGLGATALCAGGAGVAWLARPAGNAFLRGQIEQRASAMIPGSVRIGSLATGLSGSATLEDVGLLDPSGVPLLTARTVEVTWGLPSPVELVVTGLDGPLGSVSHGRRGRQADTVSGGRFVPPEWLVGRFLCRPVRRLRKNAERIIGEGT